MQVLGRSKNTHHTNDYKRSLKNIDRSTQFDPTLTKKSITRKDQTQSSNMTGVGCPTPRTVRPRGVSRVRVNVVLSSPVKDMPRDTLPRPCVFGTLCPVHRRRRYGGSDSDFLLRL